MTRRLTRPLDTDRLTIAAMADTWQLSPSWKRLTLATQRHYQSGLRRIIPWSGDKLPAEITPRAVHAFHQKMLATPAQANATVRTLQALFKFGRLSGWVDHNPADRMALHQSKPRGMIWPREAVAAFVAMADAMGHHSMATAITLQEWTGQRQADILALPRNAYRDGALLISQNKTGARVALPVDMVDALRDRLAAELERLDARPVVPLTLIVNEATGRPYSAPQFRAAFALVRARVAAETPRFAIEHLMPGQHAGAAHAFTVATEALTFDLFRHTAVTRLAEAGCTAELIAAITGHSLKSVTLILARYMVGTAEMARRAFQLRLDAEAASRRSAGPAPA